MCTVDVDPSCLERRAQAGQHARVAAGLARGQQQEALEVRTKQFVIYLTEAPTEGTLSVGELDRHDSLETLDDLIA